MTKTKKDAAEKKWKKAERRYLKMAKRIRPFVRHPETAEGPNRSSWRRTGEVPDTSLKGFISDV
jgi:hypothetical protein